MKSELISSYFDTLYDQRKKFYQNKIINNTDPWKSVAPKKWSVAQTLHHLVLMMRLYRRFSKIYIPIAFPFSYFFRNKTHKTEINDIYTDFRNKKKRPMNAPFLIVPPDNLKEKTTLEDIKTTLELETSKLRFNLRNIQENIAGHIRYFDPIADNPNLIQCINLLAIHEQHHFMITLKYLQSKNLKNQASP